MLKSRPPVISIARSKCAFPASKSPPSAGGRISLQNVPSNYRGELTGSVRAAGFASVDWNLSLDGELARELKVLKIGLERVE